MNKLMSKFWLIVALVFTVTTFSTCSDDDDKKIDYAKQITGTYTGTANLAPGVEFDVVVSHKSENVVRFAVASFSIPATGITVPSVECDCTTSDLNGNVAFTGIAKDVTILGQTQDLNVSGTVNKNGNMNMNISLGIISVIYVGTKN
ncbi:MAG: hypothetical protein LBJ72_07045 [Dysgonamonadaceae bacterium]|jgi:hypothetical protein|nr:hypothetical protein [Dysgonamonadaceae bacterium]